MSEGYIYCLSNEAMPGLVKIGEIHTEGRTPDDRIRELHTTGVPLPFNIEFAKKIANPADAEARIHAFIADKRVNTRREFFRTTPEYVRRLFDLIDGEMWVRQDAEQDEEPITNTQGRTMLNIFTDGQRIRHVIKPDKTWIAAYNSTTDRIVCDDKSYTSLSDFALKHHWVYNPERPSCNGWAECECEVNGEWVSAKSLRT
jgi:hypothetical protein